MAQGASALEGNESSRSTIEGEGPAGWLDEVRSVVDAHLARFFDARRALARELVGGETSTLIDALAELTMRGGKRLRPAVLVAALAAVRPGRGVRDVVSACAALELLQSYLLIHDDWMDGDLVRRGGPSVHARLRETAGERGDALAILAGDLGSSCAWELMLEGAWASPRGREIAATFGRIHQEVVLGQELDLVGSARVSRMQQLKTGSYTVAGPLRLGALFGEASEAQLAALERFGVPLGEAFQIRDDLLGAFGDPREVGKSLGGDLRTGKRTALIREMEESVGIEEQAPVLRVLGREASEVEVEAARRALVNTGVRARVEARLEALLDEACAALEGGGLSEPGISMLAELAGALTFRRR
jgi:geranylgeranyl diphosphate synthase type I